MQIRPLSISGAWEISPQRHGDSRGFFMEWYRLDRLSETAQSPVQFQQGNLSASASGVVRGIHFKNVPPGQAKYVSCVRGSLWDVVVDVRVGSPTFGRWEAVLLDDVDRRALYLAEGLGHGFCSLSDDTVMLYLCSTTYDPQTEYAVNPLDPRLGIDWPATAPVLSARDRAAPGLDELLDQGRLPRYEVCRRDDPARRLDGRPFDTPVGRAH